MCGLVPVWDGLLYFGAQAFCLLLTSCMTTLALLHECVGWRQVNSTDREDVVHVQYVFACPCLEIIVLWAKCSRPNKHKCLCVCVWLGVCGVKGDWDGKPENVCEQERGVTEKEKKEIRTKERTGLLREHQTALLRLSSCRTGFAHLPLPLKTRRAKTTSASLFLYFLCSTFITASVKT